MGQYGRGNTFRRQFLGGLADRQGVRLGEEVGHQLVVVAHFILRQIDRMLRTAEADEIDGDNLTLVEQLEEGMLRVCGESAEETEEKEKQHRIVSHLRTHQGKAGCPRVARACVRQSIAISAAVCCFSCILTGSGFSEVDFARGERGRLAIGRHTLAVALHVHLCARTKKNNNNSSK
jgi:hypothetical protein